MGTGNITSMSVFEYTDEGIRTSKTVNGATTHYYLNGSQILAEETYDSLCDRAIKAVDNKIIEFFGGNIPWIIPQQKNQAV